MYQAAGMTAHHFSSVFSHSLAGAISGKGESKRCRVVSFPLSERRLCCTLPRFITFLYVSQLMGDDSGKRLLRETLNMVARKPNAGSGWWQGFMLLFSRDTTPR